MTRSGHTVKLASKPSALLRLFSSPQAYKHSEKVVFTLKCTLGIVVDLVPLVLCTFDFLTLIQTFYNTVVYLLVLMVQPGDCCVHLRLIRLTEPQLEGHELNILE